MTTIVVSDVHNKIDRVKKILETPHDRAVFHGDWFDDFGDDPLIAGRTARYLKELLCNKNYTFLFGNHDVPYFLRHRATLCSGNTLGKHEVINSILTREDWLKFKLHTWAEGYLISHAGFRERFSEYEADQALVNFQQGDPSSPLLHAGLSRGGNQVYGGCTWCDWRDEFRPIPSIDQIVGHTPASEVRNQVDNWCLDTHLNHYGILTKGRLSIYPVDIQLCPNPAREAGRG